MTHHARGSRPGRVRAVLHPAGVEGMTIGEIAKAADLSPSDTKRILGDLQKFGRAEQIALRKPNALDENRRVQEVWACGKRCRLANQHKPQPVAEPEPVRLDDETRERGLAGLAEARAAVAAAPDRRV